MTMDDQALVNGRNTEDEGSLMSKGLLLKVKFPDQEEPNVQWYWLPMGNCSVCRYYRPGDGDRHPSCTHPKVDDPMFWRQLQRNDCPAFKVGSDRGMLRLGEWERNRDDAMKAAGLVDGTPSQRVEVLQKEDWNPTTSAHAKVQEDQFVAQSQHADSGNPDPEYTPAAFDPGPAPVPLKVRR